MEVLLYILMTVFSNQIDQAINQENTIEVCAQEQAIFTSRGRITFKAKEGATVDGGD